MLRCKRRTREVIIWVVWEALHNKTLAKKRTYCLRTFIAGKIGGGSFSLTGVIALIDIFCFKEQYFDGTNALKSRYLVWHDSMSKSKTIISSQAEK